MSKRGRPFGSLVNPVRNNTKVYRAWSAMKRRCLDPGCHIFKYYGGRGITVCEQWAAVGGFKVFYADMGEPSDPAMSLGRINNDGNYEPSNCRWETTAQQASNRRKAAPNPASLRQRALAAGLPYLPVYFRIHRLGWDEARALSTPIRAHA